MTISLQRAMRNNRGFSQFPIGLHLFTHKTKHPMRMVRHGPEALIELRNPVRSGYGSLSTTTWISYGRS